MGQIPLFGVPELLGLLRSDRPAVDAIGRALAGLATGRKLRRADAKALGKLLDAWSKLPRPPTGVAVTVIVGLEDAGRPFRRRVALDEDGLRLENESGDAGALRIETVFSVGTESRKASADPADWAEAFALMAADGNAAVAIEDRSPRQPAGEPGPCPDDHDWWSAL